MSFLDALTNKFYRLYKHETYGGDVEVLREDNPEGVKGEAYGAFRAVAPDVNGYPVIRGHIIVGDKFYSFVGQDMREDTTRPGGGEKLAIGWDDESDPDSFHSLVDCCETCDEGDGEECCDQDGNTDNPPGADEEGDVAEEEAPDTEEDAEDVEEDTLEARE